MVCTPVKLKMLTIQTLPNEAAIYKTLCNGQGLFYVQNTFSWKTQ